jgi:hypothetical protein
VSIDTAITRLLVMAKAAGCKDAPRKPTESANHFPFAIAYDRSGQLTNITAGNTAYVLVTIYLDMHFTRQILPASVALAQTVRDAMLKQLIADPTLGGAVAGLETITYTFGRMDYGGDPTIGYRLELTFNIRLYANG